jgi:hypothetical protein
MAASTTVAAGTARSSGAARFTGATRFAGAAGGSWAAWRAWSSGGASRRGAGLACEDLVHGQREVSVAADRRGVRHIEKARCDRRRAPFEELAHGFDVRGDDAQPAAIVARDRSRRSDDEVVDLPVEAGQVFAAEDGFIGGSAPAGELGANRHAARLLSVHAVEGSDIRSAVAGLGVGGTRGCPHRGRDDRHSTHLGFMHGFGSFP